MQIMLAYDVTLLFFKGVGEKIKLPREIFPSNETFWKLTLSQSSAALTDHR